MSGSRRVYTMTTFTVMNGREAEFIDAWKDAAAAALEFVPGAVMGEILHDRSSPNRIVAFGVWEDVAAVELWRALPEYATFATTVVEVCDEVERYNLDVIARASREIEG
jgi:heme-degrading monooxygenase HmoA